MADVLQCLLNWLELPAPSIQLRETGSAGRGLFALTAIPPATALFTIPARALLNTRSLAPHYPPALNAVQLISLHLCLYRPIYPSHSLDPLFGPYISSLPREFDSHPLTRHVNLAADSSELPPSVANALLCMHARYIHDWDTVRGYVGNNLRFLSQKPGVRLDRGEDALQEDFLWAWLNVNTRSVYHRLHKTRSHPDNLTLCPILDFANHTASGPCMTIRLTDAESSNARPIPRLGDPVTLLSPSTPTDSGAELFLTYGAHANRTLFVEYGFVAPCAADEARAEVDVQDLVQPMFDRDDGGIKKKMLQDSGYWGDWTLDGSPAVSYRLITALRLLHVPLGSPDLQRWQDTLIGLRDIVSEANESACEKTVVGVCSTVRQRALDRRRFLLKGDAVRVLWEEEYCVALRVAENMHN
ncbi:hypothetical protein B0H15DRAFT_823502 [Mycena belliarum]|uniref:SET domain-containing protein n=1 Tax=Mycena belliarum TaxID=1033014 RepID=A0AAD6UBB4_9AGAR|nr:hypothetical protein B0H15DRAFT_823502 [Mycena belliae]